MVKFGASQVAQWQAQVPANAGDKGSIPGSGRSPGEGNGKPTPVFLPGDPHGQKNLVGYSPAGLKESDTIEQEASRSPDISAHQFSSGALANPTK